jgi:hypothetical protein
MAKTTLNKKNKTLFIRKLDLNLRKKLMRSYIHSMAVHGCETWTLWKVDVKCLESFVIWCWRRMENTSCSDSVKNEILHTVKE